ncbi:DsbA family protein [Bifidobacterium samirii]|uniref:DSBA oxidoreductase n=1 Tax=Bifidobacterium samirii TaxID=2306974 RepID=A0A430FVW1_9BIFI|nr:thioredoxin domain-containing protein [Bifidobacterium samirii]RSX58130.1 DSBA oxidoreductase [Bifidobacterium samirii]
MSGQRNGTAQGGAAKRREERQAAQQARIEREAKERRQATIIGSVVACILVVLVAIGAFSIYGSIHAKQVKERQRQEQTSSEAVADARKTMNEAENRPANADDQGGVIVSKDGYGTKVDGAPTVAFYMEPLCPGCASIHRMLDDTLKQMVDAGQLNLELHFMTFQDNKSTVVKDGEKTSDLYSTRAFNGAVTILENDPDPDHLLGYLANIYAEDFQPGELDDYVSVSDDQLREQAIAADVSEEVAGKAFDGTTPYKTWLKAADSYTIRRTELYAPGSSGFSSPTLTINGTYWATGTPSKAGMSFADGFLKALGIDASKVGNASVKPSIGADGKPLEL